jgi:hypothetical protein
MFNKFVVAALALFISFGAGFIGGVIADGDQHLTRHSGSITCGNHIFLAYDFFFLDNGADALIVRLHDGSNLALPRKECDIIPDSKGLN